MVVYAVSNINCARQDKVVEHALSSHSVILISIVICAGPF